MLEEEQAATKAAAKKAKKLKQKAKTKNKQQAALIVVDEPPAQPSLEDEEEEDQFRLPQAATASLGPEAALDALSAEQLPSALKLLHLHTGMHPTAPARVVLATDGAGPQQAPLLDSHGLSQAEDASSAGHAATEHEGGISSHSNSSQSGAGTASGGKADSDAHFLQALFYCPITKAQMVEPVIAADGYTYEKSAWEEWLQHSSTSAVCGDPLPHTRFVPNVLIKSAISANQGRQHPN